MVVSTIYLFRHFVFLSPRRLRLPMSDRSFARMARNVSKLCLFTCFSRECFVVLLNPWDGPIVTEHVNVSAPLCWHQNWSPRVCWLHQDRSTAMLGLFSVEPASDIKEIQFISSAFHLTSHHTLLVNSLSVITTITRDQDESCSLWSSRRSKS